MAELDPKDVTRLLQEVERQTPGAVEQLVNLVYSDLRRIASNRMRTRSTRDSLQPTAMVNEVFLRLFGDTTPSWPDRRCFFGAVSRAMRDILVDRARRATTLKRGGNHRRVSLDDDALLWEESEAMIRLAEALDELAQKHRRQHEVVELRYFARLTEEEIGLAMRISPVTVRRDWLFARSWLLQRLDNSGAA